MEQVISRFERHAIDITLQKRIPAFERTLSVQISRMSTDLKRPEKTHRRNMLIHENESRISKKLTAVLDDGFGTRELESQAARCDDKGNESIELVMGEA
jgi:hypothetical protein